VFPPQLVSQHEAHVDKTTSRTVSVRAVTLPLAVLRMLALCLLPLASACSDDRPAYQPEYSTNPSATTTTYSFAPHPLMNPQKLAEIYGAMLNTLNRSLAPDRITLKLEASQNYAAFNDKIRRRQVHFALPNPYQTVLSQEHGYNIFGKMDNDELFRGIILVRKSSPVTSIAGLKGAKVSFPAPTALAATLLPELYMKEHGLDPRTEITQVFVGTHDSVLLNVSVGVTEAGCTSPRAWALFKRENPDKAKLIEPRWQTDTLPNNGLVALDTVPEHVRYKVAQAILHLHESAEGQRILTMAGVSRFVPATSETFAPVRAFIARYNSSVRRLKGLDE